MQRDMIHYRRRRRKMRRALAILAITLIAAFLAVGVRNCADRFQAPYNKGYHPLDEQRLKQERT